MATVNTATKRDLHADLALCEAATKGPWTHSRFAAGYVMTDDDKCTTVASVVEYNEDGSIHKKFAGDECLANRSFISESREGWVEALRRAIAAEEKWSQLRDIVVTNATGDRGESINDWDIMLNHMNEIDAEVTA